MRPRKKSNRLNAKRNWSAPRSYRRRADGNLMNTGTATYGLRVYSKTCSGKNGYERRAEAKAHARRLPGNRVYRCASCGLFHVGHSTANTRTAMRVFDRREHD